MPRQVRYAIREYACTAVDVIARRLRLSFLNVQAAEEALPKVIDIMAEELKWTKVEKERQMEMAVDFLKTEMGKGANRAVRDNTLISLTKKEIAEYVKRFGALDTEKKGFVLVSDLNNSLKVRGETI